MNQWVANLFYVAAVAYCVVGSAFYSFVAFAVPLKDALSYSQSDLDFIASAGYIGTNVLGTFIAPLIAVYPVALVVMAFVSLATGVLGWGLMALAVRGGGDVSANAEAVALFLGLAGLSVSTCYTLVLTILMTHFPGAFQFWNALLNVTFSGGGLWVWAVWVYAFDGSDLTGLFTLYSAISGASGVLFVVAVLAVYFDTRITKNAVKPVAVPDGGGADGAGDQLVGAKQQAEADAAISKYDIRAAFARLKRDDKLADAVLLFVLLFLLFGIGVTYNTNFPSLFKSISGGDDSNANNLFLYFMLAQTLGRGGCLAAIAFRERQIAAAKTAGVADADLPVPLSPLHMAGVSCVGMLCGYLGSAWSGDITGLTVTFWLISAAYGMLWVVLANSIGEVGGIEATMALYGLYAWAPAAGPLAFGQMTGRLYDAEANAADHSCYGTHCFRSALIACSGVLVLALVVFGVLAVRKHRRDTAAATATTAVNGGSSSAGGGVKARLLDHSEQQLAVGGGGGALVDSAAV